jgi:hypothetical protein
LIFREWVSVETKRLITENEQDTTSYSEVSGAS